MNLEKMYDNSLCELLRSIARQKFNTQFSTAYQRKQYSHNRITLAPVSRCKLQMKYSTRNIQNAASESRKTKDATLQSTINAKSLTKTIIRSSRRKTTLLSGKNRSKNSSKRSHEISCCYWSCLCWF